MTKVFTQRVEEVSSKKKELADKIGQLTDRDVSKLAKNEKRKTLKIILALDALNKYQHCRLGIFVKKRDILKQKSSKRYEFIDGKARLFREGFGNSGILEVDCRIACGNWHDLPDCKTEVDIYTRFGKATRNLFSLWNDLDEGIDIVDHFGRHPRFQDNFANYSRGFCNFDEEINIVDYLDKLLPKHQRGIGLFTFQNGIQNSHPKNPKPDAPQGDFRKMGDSIINKFQSNEKPLCIGLYNATNGIIWGIKDDLLRLNDEWTLNCNSVLSFRQMVCTFADLLPFINPQIRWVHIAHSEGSLIAHEALTGRQGFRLGFRRANIIKNHLITATYGGVAPIPNIVLEAVNNYSTHDIVTGWYAHTYLNKKLRPHEVLDKEAIRDYADKIYRDHVFEREGSPTSLTFEQVHASLQSSTQRNFPEREFITKYPYVSEKDNYSLNVVKSIPYKDGKFPTIEGDHAFQGITYQSKLQEDINKFRSNYQGIYGSL